MAVWTVPISWTNSAVTATQFNTEIRDHDVWLKGFADNITRSTAADSGDTTYLRIRRGSDGLTAFETSAVGLGAEFRMRIMSDGNIEWGPGSGVVDFYLSRATANRLMLVDANFGSQRVGGVDRQNFAAFVTGDTQPRVTIGTDVSDRGYVMFGPGGSTAPDTILRRETAGVLNVPAGTSLRSAGPVGDVAYAAKGGTDAFNRFEIFGSGELRWGSGTAAAGGGENPIMSRLTSSTIPYLTVSSRLDVAGGVSTKLKSGVVSDADMPGGVGFNGTLVVDTTNLRLYVRIGGIWRYATLT